MIVPTQEACQSAGFFDSKQLELLTWRPGRLGSAAYKQFYLAELLVRYTKDSDLAVLGKDGFYPFDMYGRIFTTGTMPHVN